MKAFLTLFCSICIGIVLVPTLVFGYTVAPLAFNLNVERRDIIHETIVLTNTTDRQVRIYPSVHEVATDGDGVVEAFSIPEGDARAISPTSWVEISRARIVLAPNERLEVPFTVRMNPYTEPGEYSVFIGFAEASNQPKAIAKVMAGEASGTLINLSVDTKQSHYLRLQSFLVDRFVTNPADRSITLTLFNPGDVATTPRGEVIFYDSKGREVTAVSLNDEAVKVAPDESMGYSIPMPEELSMGRYKAYLAAEYGDQMRATLNDTSFFYIVSVPQLIALFLGLFLIALLGIVLFYRRAHHDDDSAVPLYVQDGVSMDRDHDLDLKNRHE